MHSKTHDAYVRLIQGDAELLLVASKPASTRTMRFAVLLEDPSAIWGGAALAFAMTDELAARGHVRQRVDREHARPLASFSPARL